MWTPISNLLLVEVEGKGTEFKSNSGIYLPSENPHTGIVKAVGEGAWEFGTWVPSPFKPGDRVMFYPGDGYVSTELGEGTVILAPKHIVAVWRG